MKLSNTFRVAALGISLLGLGAGCSHEEAGVKTEQVTTSPDGSSTTVTAEKTVETTGENPPAPANP
jgi:hypothetical protein